MKVSLAGRKFGFIARRDLPAYEKGLPVRVRRPWWRPEQPLVIESRVKPARRITSGVGQEYTLTHLGGFRWQWTFRSPARLEAVGIERTRRAAERAAAWYSLMGERPV